MYPEMVVFDLDACLWDQEMYTLDSMPSTKVVGDLNGRGEGVKGVMSGSDKISLHPGALLALQEFHDGKYPGMKLAAASSADTPFAVKIGRQALKMLEVVPGVTVWDCLTAAWGGKDVNQIGRSPPLSSDKAATHFPILREMTGVRFDKMLFFDDCNWGDHCTKVATRCLEPDTKLGPVTLKTPMGLRVQEWQMGMKKYAEERGGK